MNNKKMNITIVRKGSFRSYHTSFKKACKVYGWNYDEAIKGGTPKTWKGYKIEKMITEVSIPDQMLALDILKNDFKVYCSDDWSDEVQKFEATLGDWQIEGIFTVESRNEDISTDRGTLTEVVYTVGSVDIQEVYDREGDEVINELSLQAVTGLSALIHNQL